jgi:hypothetical protein
MKNVSRADAVFVHLTDSGTLLKHPIVEQGLPHHILS